MPKTKTAPLADGQVTYLPAPSGISGSAFVIRASALKTRDGAIVLEDAQGHALFIAPLSAVAVRYVEPGQTLAAPDPVTPDAEKTAPPARRRSSGTRA